MSKLSCDKLLLCLTASNPDPKDSSKIFSNILLYTRDTKDSDKFEILKKALICFVQNHKMKKVATGLVDTHTFAYKYPSTTWDTMLKTSFSYFAERGIIYTQITLNWARVPMLQYYMRNFRSL